MKRNLLRIGFAVYILLMLWLLFIRYRNVEITDYWAQIAYRLRLRPFRTIWGLLRMLWYNRRLSCLWTVIYNIGGNIIMFIPLGFFLRSLLPRCQSFWRCMGTVALIMTTVELVQLFTLRGFCETDDMLLNVTGAAVGWLAAKRLKTS